MTNRTKNQFKTTRLHSHNTPVRIKAGHPAPRDKYNPRGWFSIKARANGGLYDNFVDTSACLIAGLRGNVWRI